ncbi:MAG TPA: ankyrin repeat domain-containing protein [Bryobacteraceae bacterium]|nr:ankyrin repeat domain-containing protein [Bryobacteraceae bacterium]
MRASETVFWCALLLGANGAAGPASPVADAAMRGDKSAVAALLRQNADVNAPQPDGATAIQWAAYNNDLATADLLIAAGADVKTPNRDGATPLQLASINGNAPMIEKLLAAGADPNERSPRGETPLMFASRNGNTEAIKVLLDRRADVNAKESLRGTTALMWAVEQRHPEAVRLLVERGANVMAVTNPDNKGGTAYLAPSVQQRAAQDRNFALRPNRPVGRGQAQGPDDVAALDAAAAEAAFGRNRQNTDGGGLTPLVFAAREDCLECARILVQAGADVNQTSRYGWTPLLTAVQNRHYQLAKYLLEHGADPNIKNKGGWTPLYLAVDNRNIEGGDYPVRPADMDHLDFIKLLIDRGADVNGRICGAQSTAAECKGDSTETRTIFTMQWLYEAGATPFLRAAQSADLPVMKLLLQHGADPKIETANGDTALMVASGIGWVEGVTFEWSEADNLEAVKMCLDLGIDPNAVNKDGRTALHGAAHKGRNAVVQILVDHGAKLDAHDNGSRDTFTGALFGHTWEPVDYARGLVRVGVQSAIAHPETEALLEKLMKDRGIPIPPPTNQTVCLTDLCNGKSRD